MVHVHETSLLQFMIKSNKKSESHFKLHIHIHVAKVANFIKKLFVLDIKK